MVKPFYAREIDRYKDVAWVRIYHITDDGGNLRRELVADYETLSRGAARSAAREIKKLSAQQVSA